MELEISSAPDVRPDYLDRASACYYYKPMAALFGALHLRAYASSGIKLDSPVLDIGCSDGLFGVLLTDSLGVHPSLTGVEMNAQALKNAGARARGRYKAMIQASATDLPFADASFKTVMFNASLFAVKPGLESALSEAFRVLEPGGELFATVATHDYSCCCWLARLLDMAGLHRQSRRYSSSMDQRIMLFHLYTASEWTSLVEQPGFSVRQCFGFMSPGITTYWSFLAWTPLRLLGAARYIPGAALRRIMSRLVSGILRKPYEQAGAAIDPDKATYILIKAVKPHAENGASLG